MKSRIIFSPFMAYCFSFLLVIPVYFLDWTYLFPKLGSTLLIFFIITFCIAIIGAMFFKDLLNLNYKEQRITGSNKYALLLVIFYLMEFAYSREIPLLSLFSHIGYLEIIDTSFGIPTFHVFVVGYTAFIGIFFFHCYLSQKKKKYLLFFIVCLLLALSIISRITCTFLFIGSIYVYLMSIRKNFLLKIAKISFVAILFFACFGMIGNLRSTNELNASEFILDVSEAKPSFRQSGIPESFFWTYMYIASPLANLELNIDRREAAFTWNNFNQFVIHEFLWDAISKRIDAKYDYNRTDITQINSSFNVGSVFSKAYAYLGLGGMYIMFMFMFVVAGLYLFTLNAESKYFITYLAAFNTLIVLCIFDNIFSFTPLSIILIFPVVEKLKKFFLVSKDQPA